MSKIIEDLLLDIQNKKKLNSMRLQNSTGELKDNSKIKKKKVEISRLKTAVSQKRREDDNG